MDIRKMQIKLSSFRKESTSTRLQIKRSEEAVRISRWCAPVMAQMACSIDGTSSASSKLPYGGLLEHRRRSQDIFVNSPMVAYLLQVFCAPGAKSFYWSCPKVNGWRYNLYRWSNENDEPNWSWFKFWHNWPLFLVLKTATIGIRSAHLLPII